LHFVALLHNFVFVYVLVCTLDICESMLLGGLFECVAVIWFMGVGSVLFASFLKLEFLFFFFCG